MTNTAVVPLLVPLGRRDDGLRSVLLHPAGGGLAPYLPVAAQLDRLGPVYGIRAAGLLPGEEPDQTVPAMVERYEALLDHLDGPPDLLFGWSLGGVLAWELAARLAAGGHRPRVVMVDSPALPHPVKRAVRLRVLRELDTAGPFAEMAVATASAHIDAVARHEVRAPLDLPALLLTCRDSDGAADIAAWRRLGERLRVAELPGDHFDVFSPHVLPVLSAGLTRFLTDTEEAT